ncbi:plasmid pRiA4b ORF-3 family protein [Geobacter sp. AOG2]|uniref:plasmid pRiA4b ORF-3 family protein n=1 Tax=Geobacter sp. AOG2 TaxID=1566347 RepID=UPI001CC3A3F2
MPPIRQIYQMKITLKNIEPPIWRRIQTPSSATFGISIAIFRMPSGGRTAICTNSSTPTICPHHFPLPLDCPW